MSAFRERAARLLRASPPAAQGGSEPVDGSDALEQSSLFDLEWWRLTSGRDTEDRAGAVRSFLAGEPGSPHPLWLLPTSSAGLREDPASALFLSYVRERRWQLQTHPLFDVADYLGREPDALRHPDGPLGHYRDVGAPRGVPPNAWYQPDPLREPGGLADWVRARAAEWHERRRPPRPVWVEDPPASPHPGRPSRRDGLGTVSVLLAALDDPDELDRTLSGLRAQTYDDLEILVADRQGGSPGPREDDPRVRRVPQGEGVWASWSSLLAASTGEWVTFAAAGDRWPAERVAHLAAAHAGAGPDAPGWWQDVADRGGGRAFLGRPLSRESLLRGARPDPACLLLPGPASRAHGIDPDLRQGGVLDLLLWLCRHHGEPGLVPTAGPRIGRGRARRLVHAEGEPAFRDAALARHLVDWAALEARPARPGLTSVVVPTYRDHEMTCSAVESVVGAAAGPGEVEVVVVDNGSGLEASVVLASLSERYPGQVRVLHRPENHGFALGNDLGLAECAGDVVVFLNNDARVAHGWLEPLRRALGDEQVLGAQSLLLFDSGAVQSAGIVFPPGDGLPHELLRGHPEEDARRVLDNGLHALTGAALALRRDDVVQARGFDPVFRNGLEDVDLCLRLATRRPGRFVVPEGSVVTHLESRSERRFQHVQHNRRQLLQRWRGRLPSDDAALWGRAGFEVVGRRPRPGAREDNRLRPLEPVVVRAARPRVEEAAPRLRWAIKNPAVSGVRGDHWGDTAYAAALARALRDLGQEVVVDRRGAFDRDTGWHDDVVLGLHGRVAPTPVPGQVSLLWVISHPDRLARVDLAGWDRVYVASAPFAAQLARTLEVPVSTMHQATDPGLFHPDRARPDTGPPLLFLGNSRGARRPAVDWALDAGLPLTLVGTEWDGLVPVGTVQREHVPNEEAGAWYRSAGIVLNDHWEDMRVSGFLSNRLFDAVASGARVVTDDVRGLREVLGESVVVVSSSEELAAVVAADLDETFGDDGERRRRAAEVAQQHSFAARAEELLEGAVRAWRERVG